MSVFRDQVVELISAAVPAEIRNSIDVSGLLEVPPDPQFGDYAFPTFSLARHLRRAPALIASDLAAAIPQRDWLAQVSAVGGYVNFTIDKAELARVVLRRALGEGDRYGGSTAGGGQTMIVEFSSPNVAKPVAVHLIRTTALGHSLSRLFEFGGYQVLRWNHLGDWGTQNGQWIVGWRKWGVEERLRANPVKELASLYARFHAEAETHPELEAEARETFRRLEAGVPEERALWERFRALSVTEFQRVYARMGIVFDSYEGESFYTDKMDAVVAMLAAKGLLQKSEGATIVDLGEELPPSLILRSDGATLYATRDLAAAIYRWEKYHPALVLYVVDLRQSLHFQQVFAVLRRADCTWIDRYEHIAYGTIKFGNAIMSTRAGNLVVLEDVLDEAAARALAIIEERNPALAGKERVAEQVGIGAVIFRFLLHNRLKDISFDWESALSFDGDTGPYVQYTHARVCSILRKAGMAPDPAALDTARLDAPEEIGVVRALDNFPAVVAACMDARDPSGLARYLLDLCQAFNAFYHAHRVVGSAAMPERLALVQAVRIVLRNGLYLLGLAAPEEM